MTDSRAVEIVRRYERLKSERAVWEGHWEEIAELVRPMRSDFVSQRTPGSKRMDKVFDGTPGIAADNLASGLWSMVSSSANEWFSLKHENEDLDEVEEVKLWLSDVARRMRNVFSANGQRFYVQLLEAYKDLVTFGTAVYFEEEDPTRRSMFFSSRHLAECYIAENEIEQVDTLYRKFKFTARQAEKKWGDKVGPEIQRCLEKEPDRIFEFIHGVYPSDEYDGGRTFKGGRAYKSCYVQCEAKTLLSEGGYYEFPYQVPRWAQTSRAAYGDAPAMLALPDIKMLNAMSKTTIIGAQKAVDPPLLAPTEKAVRGIRTSPGGIIYGGVNSQGNQIIHPLMTGAKVDLGLEMEDQRRNAIREAFYWSMMMMVNQPDMTATEVLARQEEKMRMMGPHMGRIQSELLNPLITRVFNIMFRAGAFPEPPDILLENPNYKIEYVSPLARAQKTTEAAAISRAFEAVMPMAQADPAVLDRFDLPEAAVRVADALGVPAVILRDKRAAAKLAQQRQMSQTAQMMAAGAEPVAGAVKKAAEAQQIGLQTQQMVESPEAAQSGQP